MSARRKRARRDPSRLQFVHFIFERGIALLQLAHRFSSLLQTLRFARASPASCARSRTSEMRKRIAANSDEVASVIRAGIWRRLFCASNDRRVNKKLHYFSLHRQARIEMR